MTGFVMGIHPGTDAADLAEVGGKALNLLRLTAAGFAVPDGFIVTTGAYRQFIVDNDLGRELDALLASSRLGEPTELDRVSDLIRALFRRGELADELKNEIATAWRDHAGEQIALAVRSSATAEDLPGLSFAGQQDSYLNVIGLESVYAHIVECWSSLWTARALGYRHAHGVDHLGAALAVVVQQLVPAESSGVLFTANPVTGVRDETVVDATAGLGEALVSGQVDPDHIVLDRAGRVLHSSVGGKAMVTRALPAGGVETVAADPGQDQVLSAPEIASLADLVVRIEREYDSPQDVEWAFADGQLWVLQSRPITTLFDVPVSFAELAGRFVPGGGRASGQSVWLSFGAVQGVLGPITPLGRDVLAHVIAGVTALVGPPRRVDHLTFAGVAHERLFLKIDTPLRHPLGRRVALAFLGIAEPGSVEQVRELVNDPRFGTQHNGFRPMQMLATARLGAKAAGFLGARVARTMARPERARASFDATVARLLRSATRRQEATDQIADLDWRLHAQVAGARAGARSGLRSLLPAFGPIGGPCVAMMGLLGRMAADLPGAQDLPYSLLKGLPGNVTTEMDLRLWAVATEIRTAGESDALLAATPSELAETYLKGSLSPVTQAEITSFLSDYGMRGVAEIDLGRPRWREDPAGVFATLRSYVQSDDPAKAPDAVFERGAREAAEAQDALAELAGPLRAPLVRLAARRIRGLFGIRETPKFTLITMFGLIRAGLLDSAAELVRAGFLDEPTDIAYLRLSELDDPAGRPGLRALVTERRQLIEQEETRRIVPRIICGNGLALYGGSDHRARGGTAGGSDEIKGGQWVGSGVSPGVVEATVRVVFDPRTADLQPGEVLVCPGTDPAWTPLFLVAAGLITEVGGMMTHGSVVAREYGIPAVVGVAGATTGLRDGQLVRLDGSSGTVTLL